MGSDVVYCVWVSLTSMIVAVFWAHASLVAIGSDVVLTLYNIVDIWDHALAM